MQQQSSSHYVERNMGKNVYLLDDNSKPEKTIL